MLAGLSYPREDLSSRSEYSSHLWNLLPTLVLIVLIDADRMNIGEKSQQVVLLLENSWHKLSS
jgi:hypothetical protein